MKPSTKSQDSSKRIAVIVSTSDTCYVGFVLTNTDDGYAVYWNSKCKPISLIQDQIRQNFKTIPIKEFNNNEFEAVKEWAEKIAQINLGIDQDTSMIPLDLSGYTPKQQRVIEVAQRLVPVNEYVTYGRVAMLADLPNAHRFVGTTMKICRQPWIIPVQRIKNTTFIKKLKKSVKRSMPL